MSITPLATYMGDKTKYPMTKEIRKNIEAPYTVVSQADGVEAFKLTNAGTFLEPDELFGHGTRITRCMLWEFIQGQSEKL